MGSLKLKDFVWGKAQGGIALLAFAITDLLDLWKRVREFHQSICLRATEVAHTGPVGVMVLHF
jgi:hypothetical protein